VLRSHLEAQNISRHRITGVLNKPVDLNALYNSLNI
jgi:hypothetical protein